MSKVHEEKWRAGNQSSGERGELFDAEGDTLGSFNTLPSRDYDDSEEAYARARLAAQAPAMARLLLAASLRLQEDGWADISSDIDVVLRAAGVLDDAPKTSEGR
jgi:hypothetical protein